MDFQVIVEVKVAWRA